MKAANVLIFIVILAALYFGFSKIFGTGKIIDFSYNKDNSIITILPWFSREKRAPAPKKPSVVVEKRVIDAISEPVPPVGFSISDLSPHYKKVKINSVTKPTTLNEGGFEIRANSTFNETLNITGWRLRNNKGNGITIPKAISDYAPRVSQIETDINLKANDYVRFYGSAAPIKGLRLNKCTGFLGSVYTFKPTLPASCPNLYERAEIASFSGDCQDYILSLRSCEVPDLNEYYSKVSAGNSACRSFIDRFNYSGCYNSYKNEGDFYSREWRVWLNQRLSFDPLHDRLILLDKEGLLVNEYSY